MLLETTVCGRVNVGRLEGWKARRLKGWKAKRLEGKGYGGRLEAKGWKGLES